MSKKKLEPISNEKVILWDQDGTMANIFVNGFLEKVFYPGFFEGLDEYPETIKAIKEIHRRHPHIKQYLCSTLTPTKHCETEKNGWLDVRIGDIIPMNRRIFVPHGSKKSDCIPGDISKVMIVDDYSTNCFDVKEAGGMAVKYKNDINCKNGTWKGPIVNGLGTYKTIYQELMDYYYDYEGDIV